MPTRRALLLGALGTAACSRKSETLYVYNWSDYIGPTTLADFEAETGIHVRYGTFENIYELLAKIMTGNSGWDVVFPSAEVIQPLIEAGLLQELDHARLPGLANLDPYFQQPPWDPQLRYSVPYMFGTTGIAYQKSAAPVEHWSDLWSVRLAGRVTMLDDPSEVFAACLAALGFRINTHNPAELEKAKAYAIEQKRVLRAYLSGEVRDQLVSGDVLAAQLWNGSSGQAIAAAPGRLAYALPSEGFLRFADSAAILKESPRQAAAHRFIEFLLRPNVVTAIAQATSTATANRAALDLMPASRNNPVLYPPPAVLAPGQWIEALPAPIQRLRDRLWTEIKSA